VVDLDRLLRYVSEQRFRRYLEDSGNDERKALELYEWNARLCSAFVVPVHHYEVGVRNVFHDRISEVKGDVRWFRAELKAAEVEAGMVVSKEGPRLVVPGAVVANLTLGFWVNLTAAHQHDRYWIANLSEVFLHRESRPSRKVVNKELSSVQHLRNRIAHHEPIYHRRLERSWDRMQRFLGWIDPEFSEWVTNQSDVSEILKQDPRR